MRHKSLHVLCHLSMHTCMHTYMLTYVNLFICMSFRLSRLLPFNTPPLTLTLPHIFPVPLSSSVLRVALLPACLTAFLPLPSTLPSSCLLYHSELRCRDRTLYCRRSPPLPAYFLRWPYSRYITSPQSTAQYHTMPCHAVLSRNK